MAGIGADWIAFAAFVVLMAASIIAEVAWLRAKAWMTTGRAVGFVVATDLLGVGIGMAIVGICMLVIFMMVMGPAGTGGCSPDWAYVLVTIIGLIVPMATLVFLKRGGLAVFKIQAGKAAWRYSLINSLLLVILVFLLPALIFWILSSVA